MAITSAPRTAPDWASVVNQPAVPGAVAQPSAFGAGANDLFELYQRALDAGMTQQEAAQYLSQGSAAQFRQAIERMEADAIFGDLGTPVYSPARTRETSSEVLQRQLQQQAAQQAAALAASRQLTPEQQAIEDRYGHDMAWLDPSFQYEAQTVAPITTQDALRYGTTADPAAQAQQRRAVEELFGRASAGASGDEQRAMGGLAASADQLNAIADRGATGEERSSLNRASEVARELRRRAAVGATEDERVALSDQRRVMEALFGDYEQGASDVELEAQGAQRRAMNELFGLWEGGGATALERARRAQARSEAENWLEGQRKADLQDLAERGMSGSGAELASLQADRQAAAQRLSLADLETDAALEERALQALLSGGAQAGELLAGESGIQARRLQQLFGAGDAARGVSSTLGDIEGRGTQQLVASGGLEGDVARTYGGIEDRGLRARLGAADAYGAYGGIASTVEGRALEALLGAERGATSMRNASDAYVGANADRLFDAATFNADAINRAASQNKEFLQNAWRDTMADRTRWDMQSRDIQAQVALGLLGSDVKENIYGHELGFDTASSDVAARNRAQQNYNTTTLGAYTGTSPMVYDAAGAQNAASTGGLRTGGETIQQAGQATLNYFTGGMGGMAMGRQPYSSGGGGAVINPTDEQNPYRRGY